MEIMSRCVKLRMNGACFFKELLRGRMMKKEEAEKPGMGDAMIQVAGMQAPGTIDCWRPHARRPNLSFISSLSI